MSCTPNSDSTPLVLEFKQQTSNQTSEAANAKPVVAVDVDEVLGKFVSQLAAFHNEAYGTSLTLRDFHSYHFRDVWGGTDDEATTKVRDFFASKYFEDIPVLEGSKAVLSKFADDFTFIVVTARQHFLEDVTREWLSRHFEGLFTEVLFGNHYGRTGKKTTKGELCRGINAVCLIDDSMVHALDCAPDMAKVILVDIDGEYMWNKEQPASPSPVSSPAASPTTPDLLSNSVSTSPSTPSNIVRALSWNDVEKELASLRDSLKALKQ